MRISAILGLCALVCVGTAQGIPFKVTPTPPGPTFPPYPNILPLVDRGNGLIYDPNQNLTWVQNASLSGQSTLFTDAYLWAQDLEYGGFSDWRLPYFYSECGSGPNGEDGRFYCTTGNELAFLYYAVLGNKSGPDGGPDNFVPFTNLPLSTNSYFYHLQRANGQDPLDYSFGTYLFDLSSGRHLGELGVGGRAWAVRSGDVTTVPEPTTIALLVAGLAGIAFRKRRGST